MEEGILKIKGKNGQRRLIKIPGSKVQLKKEMEPIGQEFDNEKCQYEGNPATKVIVAGKTFTLNPDEVQERKKKEAEKERRIQKEKKTKEIERQQKKLKEQQERSKDSFVLAKSRVPKDTREIWIEDGDNFSLKLNKFARYDYKDKKREEKDFTFYNPREITTGKPNYEMVLPEMRVKPNFGNTFSIENQLSQRLVNSVKQLCQEHSVSTNIFTPSWRLVVGLGGDSVYQTGMTLHHIYGVPYIPASSIKGVLRSWVIKSCFDNNENNALEDEMFGCVFGTQKKRGDVTFFDALPTSEPKIEPDIMNPHYPEYYAEKSAPVDTDSPNPIFFLTVKDTSFQFIMVSEEINIENQLLWDDYNLNWWLENALSEHGIGAKTAVGYGYMNRG